MRVKQRVKYNRRIPAGRDFRAHGDRDSEDRAEIGLDFFSPIGLSSNRVIPSRPEKIDRKFSKKALTFPKQKK